MEKNILDPSTFTVEMLKAMCMWPPQDNIGVAIAPELRRMGREIDIIDLGVGKGESIIYINDNVPNIKKIYGLVHTNEYDNLIEKNLIGIDKVERTYSGEDVDALLITMTNDTTGQTLTDYYSKLKVGGIIVGDKYGEDNTKISLSDFRLKNRITININIIKKDFWFWKKR